VAHLARTISWYRRVIAVEQSSEMAVDKLERDNAQRTTTRSLQLAFDFARASLALVSPDSASPSTGAAASAQATRPNVEQAIAKANTRISRIEARIAEADAALAGAGGQRRKTLTLQRKELAAELALAKQIQETVSGFRVFLSSQPAGGGGMTGIIDRMERSVPEAMRGTQGPAPPQSAATATGGAAANADLFRPESAGIFGLATEAIRTARAKTQIRGALAETDDLRKNLEQLRTPLTAEIRSAIQRSDEAADSSDSATKDAQQIEADRQDVEALTARFKQVSAAVMPLREQRGMIESVRGNLQEWHNTAEQRYSNATRYLLLRVLAMAGAIVLILAISELWRRGTFRYVKDARRRRQFLLLRRIVVSCVVAAAILMGLATEFGSIATYAGFLTAGLAVALQNVILSVVAYFFLIGRYGLRVGDRVTISGVTGDVLDIGLVRIYLMEMAGADPHTTGRVVVFSNAVVFQPAALFRQMPGTDYAWHTVTLTLSPDSDIEAAEGRLLAAVETVYEQYRERIEQQHAAFQRLVDVPVAPPRPAGTLRFINEGVEYRVRYPVEMRDGSATDDQVVKALCDAIAREPGLALTSSGGPKLQG
jgi:small-conductance mechanosensitive channel